MLSVCFDLYMFLCFKFIHNLLHNVVAGAIPLQARCRQFRCRWVGRQSMKRRFLCLSFLGVLVNGRWPLSCLRSSLAHMRMILFASS